jgi:hypothetical protein
MKSKDDYLPGYLGTNKYDQMRIEIETIRYNDYSRMIALALVDIAESLAMLHLEQLSQPAIPSENPPSTDLSGVGGRL